MKGKIFVGSVSTAVLILLVSFTSAVSVQTTKQTTASSPLFTHTRNMALQQTSVKINSNFLGKGNNLQGYFSTPSIVNHYIDKAIALIQENPTLIKRIFSSAHSMPYILQMLQHYGISQQEFETCLNQLQNDPSLLQAYLQQVQVKLSGDDPSSAPLSLNTANPIGCVITVIALLPVIITIALLIATITIVTCLNIGGCFEAIGQQLIDNFLQGLRPPNS